MVYRPAASVRVAVPVPTTPTATPASGWPVVASATVPVTVVCWNASARAVGRKAAATRAERAIHNRDVRRLKSDLVMFPSILLWGLRLRPRILGGAEQAGAQLSRRPSRTISAPERDLP
jgi:hypothetical protein